MNGHIVYKLFEDEDLVEEFSGNVDNGVFKSGKIIQYDKNSLIQFTYEGDLENDDDQMPQFTEGSITYQSGNSFDGEFRDGEMFKGVLWL